MTCWFSFSAADGKCSGATGLQLGGVLDELFSYGGPLGIVYSDDAISLFLWAPTAQVCYSIICLSLFRVLLESDFLLVLSSS